MGEDAGGLEKEKKEDIKDGHEEMMAIKNNINQSSQKYSVFS